MALDSPTGTPINPENAENLEDIEKQFAVKGDYKTKKNQNPKELATADEDAVVQHMETYWKILEMMPGSKLRLTKFDDDIHDHFKNDFPEFDPAATINEDEMKSKDGKEKWRKFIAEYEKTVEDYNYGTMLRASPKTEYDESGTIFAVRMQFYAIEIARNRAGLNDWIYEATHPAKK